MSERERDIALMEGHMVRANEDYFSARIGWEHTIGTSGAFDAGYRRGWNDHAALSPAPSAPEPAPAAAVGVTDDDLFKPERLEQIIDNYLADYELRGDEGSHTPSDDERFVIKDAIMGLLADPDWDAEWGNLIDERAAALAASPAPAPQADVREALAEFVAIKPLPYGAHGTRDVDIGTWHRAWEAARRALEGET